MKPLSVLVFTLCIISALAQDKIFPEGVSDAIKLYTECRKAEGLGPCLKMKVLSLIDRASRMDRISFMDGVVLKANPEVLEKEPTLEDEEKNLPRALDAKDEALTDLIFTRTARMFGSKTIEISMPKLVESARKGEDGGKFGDFLGGGEEGGKKKKKKKDSGMGLKMFISSLIAHKISMIPLYLGALFFLAKKALIAAKIALLIIGLISFKKLVGSKNSGGHVEHIVAGYGGGHGGGHGGGGYGGGGYGGGGHGGGGWNGGYGGWNQGWDKRSMEVPQNIAYNGQKPT